MPQFRSSPPKDIGETSLSVEADMPWHRQAGTRIAALWGLKFGASIGFIGIFFVGYFLLLKYPVFEPRSMPVLALDRWVPFQTGALWVYISLWLYVQLPVALLLHYSDVVSYGKALVAMSAVGFAIFFFFPTTLTASDIDWTQHAAFRTLKEVDASGNACPSLHVAFALFSACSLARTLRKIRAPRVVLVINALWCAGIIYSTVATRQHVVLDVVGGIVLALAVWQVYARFAFPLSARPPAKSPLGGT